MHTITLHDFRRETLRALNMNSHAAVADPSGRNRLAPRSEYRRTYRAIRGIFRSDVSSHGPEPHTECSRSSTSGGPNVETL